MKLLPKEMKKQKPKQSELFTHCCGLLTANARLLTPVLHLCYTWYRRFCNNTLTEKLKTLEKTLKSGRNYRRDLASWLLLSVALPYGRHVSHLQAFKFNGYYRTKKNRGD
jgi:hypothetical protein